MIRDPENILISLAVENRPSPTVAAIRMEQLLLQTAGRPGGFIQKTIAKAHHAKHHRGSRVRKAIGKVAATTNKTARRIAGPMAAAASLLEVLYLAVAVGANLSGANMEKVGRTLNEFWLGDLDEEARAAMATRNGLSAELLSHVGREGKVSGAMAQMFQEQYERNLARERGDTLFRDRLPVDSKLDMLIKRSADKLKQLFEQSEAKRSAYRIAEGWHRRINNGQGMKQRR